MQTQLLRVLLFVIAVPLAAVLDVRGQEIGFLEDYALAEDRQAALRQLVPGTEAHFFYLCLTQQHAGELEAVDRTLAEWVRQLGRGGRVQEIENRQALLKFGVDPDETARFLIDRLGLKFDHQRQIDGAAPDLPTALDPGLVTPSAWIERALSQHPRSLKGFGADALWRLAGTELDGARLGQLLNRLEVPDFPRLAQLVLKDLRSPGDFGNRKVHGLLTLAQLQECVRQRPELLTVEKFVNEWLEQLAPGADDAWRNDASAREAYLDRLWAFVQQLGPSFNSLKGHVLYHRLEHDRSRGVTDRERLQSYLRLPRPFGYVPEKLQRDRSRVRPDARFPTGLPAIGDDEALVRACLADQLVDASGYEAWTSYVRESWLRRLFVETKLLRGIGDPQQWVSMVRDPAWFEELRQRVEIRFAATRRERFGEADPVAIDVELKNVGSLLVRVFEIDTFNHCVGEGRDVDASLELDGLVPNEERAIELDADPLRRVTRRFEFPGMRGAGVWIVEFLGNGIASRAVVRKGGLRLIERRSSAGHVLAVHDSSGQKLSAASVWFGGRDYPADPSGDVLLPYSTAAGKKSVVLRHQGLAVMAEFDHAAELYALAAKAHVEREALLPGNAAQIVVRSDLTLAGVDIDPGLLENVRLQITATDRRGTVSNLDVANVQIAAGREYVTEITVPDNLRYLRVALHGQIKSLTTGDTVELHAACGEFRTNEIDETAEIGAHLLSRTPSGYRIEVRGKDGEVLPDQPVRLTLASPGFSDVLDVALRSDGDGRVDLGRLETVSSVWIKVPGASFRGWEIGPRPASIPDSVTVAAGESVRLALPGGVGTASRDFVALFEVDRSGRYRRDVFDAVRVERGFLIAEGLEPGDYRLLERRTARATRIQVVAGERRGSVLVGGTRWSAAEPQRPLQITELALSADEAVVRLDNAGPATRVHLVATRYDPPFDLVTNLSMPEPAARYRIGTRSFDATTYREGRKIGDEYRYILERRQARKFPGNMLERPGILLNPWDLAETETAIGLGGGSGGRFGGRGGARRRMSAKAGEDGRRSGDGRYHPGAIANLSFLPEGAVVLTNLKPDAEGVVRVARAGLGAGHMLRAVAVDRRETAWRELVIEPIDFAPTSVRLTAGLDPERSYAEQRRIEFLDTGSSSAIENPASASVSTLDTIGDVHALFRSVTNDEQLARFAFVTRWPSLEEEQKRVLYSEHACHELHLFLYRKDRQFFDAVVRPYLSNKADPTFLDRWLLEKDLSADLDSWAFGQLNVVEKILLARRVGAEGALRLVDDVVATQSVDPAADARSFYGYLAADGLRGANGIAGKLKDLKKGLRDSSRNKRVNAAGDKSPAQKPAKTSAPVPEPKEADEDAAAEFEEFEEVVEEALDSVEGVVAADKKRREQVRRLYRAPRATRRFAESNYWRVPIERHTAALVEPNRFWRDFARHGSGPFVSDHLMAATGSFTEMMLALALTDLPFEAGEHDSRSGDSELSITAASPMLLVRREIGPAAAQSQDSILVSQDFFRLDTRYEVVDGKKRDAWVAGEFEVGVPYGCQVVVTNPTSTVRDLDVLLQIPVGAIPVRNSYGTDSRSVRLGAYSTQALDYAFYFPRSGSYRHYPVHIASDGAVVAAASATAFDVVDELTAVSTASWQYVSQRAESEAVLGYLAEQNLGMVDLDRMAWRMADRGFFTAALERLRQRHVYAPTLWSYGFRHRDTRAMREWLEHADVFLRQCGATIESPLVSVDPVRRRWYQHIEYAPLVNPRAHRFGRAQRILNGDLARQYRALLDVLAHRAELGSDDWMDVTYYLLLQDRVGEALEAFAKVDPQRVSMRLQHDAMRAYLAFYTADTSLAREIATRYANHPVSRWRARFAEMLAHLDAAEGQGAGGGGETVVDVVAQESTLDMTVGDRRVELRYSGVDSVEVRYFLMDVEFLFSSQPFVQQGAGAFAYVKANRLDRVALDVDREAYAFALPAEFDGRNVLVEVRGAGITRRTPVYANALAVRWIEGQGQVAVRDPATDRPLSKVYVKVYGRQRDGTVRFHKDGYTDLRGRFDYVSMSGDGAMAAERYAVLVLSEDRGAEIREVRAPAR